MLDRLRAARAAWPLWTALLLVVVGRWLIREWSIYPDEAGFYFVGESLLEGGPELYGRYWVDRPPVLIWIFALGSTLGDVPVMRALATVVLLGFVVIVWATTKRMGGRAGWAAYVAAAFAISPLVGAEAANGEAFAIPFVAAGVYAVLRAVQSSHRAHAAWWALAGGVAGALAVSVKQNFADVFVFATVLLVAMGLRRQRTWATVARLLAAGVAGAAAVGALLVVWTWWRGFGFEDLWLAVVQFRADASDVLAAGDQQAIEGRGQNLRDRALAFGLVPFGLAVLALAAWTRFKVSALSYAIGVLILFEALCVVLGGNYWPHYLMGLAPGLALAAGAWGRWRVMRAVAAYVVVVALVSIWGAQSKLDRPDRAQEVGRFVGAAAEPGDTLTTMYGQSDLQWASGMDSPYRHLWSLPIRVLDPELEELIALLESDEAPTWLVQTVRRHQWGLDPDGDIDAVMRENYDFVWGGCGHFVWLREGTHRQLSGELPACPGRT